MWWLLLSCARTCPEGETFGAGGCHAAGSGDSGSGDSAGTGGSVPPEPAYTVCAAGGAPFRQIAEAVEAGEVELTVCAGTYAPVSLTAPVTLLGVDGAEVTVLGDGVTPGLVLGDTELVIRGFTVLPGGEALTAWRTVATLEDIRVVTSAGTTLVSQDGGNLAWDGLELRGNTADWLYATSSPSIVSLAHVHAEGNTVTGLFELSSSAVTWSNSLLVANVVADRPVRVSPAARDSAWVTNLTVWDNQGPGGDWWAVELVGTESNLTFENSAVGGAAGGGVRVTDAVYRYNDAWGNPTTNLLATGVTGDGNFEVDAGLDASWHPSPGSPLVDAANPDEAYRDADGSRGDVGAFGGPEGSGW